MTKHRKTKKLYWKELNNIFTDAKAKQNGQKQNHLLFKDKQGIDKKILPAMTLSQIPAKMAQRLFLLRKINRSQRSNILSNI